MYKDLKELREYIFQNAYTPQGQAGKVISLSRVIEQLDKVIAKEKYLENIRLRPRPTA